MTLLSCKVIGLPQNASLNLFPKLPYLMRTSNSASPMLCGNEFEGQTLMVMFLVRAADMLCALTRWTGQSTCLEDTTMIKTSMTSGSMISRRTNGRYYAGIQLQNEMRLAQGVVTKWSSIQRPEIFMFWEAWAMLQRYLAKTREQRVMGDGNNRRRPMSWVRLLRKTDTQIAPSSIGIIPEEEIEEDGPFFPSTLELVSFILRY